VDVDIPASSTAEKETISVKVWARRVWTLELSLVGDPAVDMQTAGWILMVLTDLMDLKLGLDHFFHLVLSHFAFRTSTSSTPLIPGLAIPHPAPLPYLDMHVIVDTATL
jgi:hypothetical protein